MNNQAFNPFLPLNTCIADGEPHVFGDRVYLYGSHDAEGGSRFCELDYEVWSAPVDDLTAWRSEGTVFRAEQCPLYCSDRTDLYAPDVTQGPDGRYYLFYGLFGAKGHGFDSPICVAVCDTPAGRFEHYGIVHYPDGRPMMRFIPFDCGVLNDNGRIWLTYGWGLGMDTHAPFLKQAMPFVMSKLFRKSMDEIRAEEPQSILGANIVELEADMVTVKSEPKRILPALNNAPKGSEMRAHSFYEAASLRKVGDWYYFLYSSHVNHELCYAVSRYPDRGYQYRGVIVSNGDIGLNGRKPKDRLNLTGNIHGSIEKINGQWYVFYHRHTHNSTYSRQACAEPIEIGPDGVIQQVELTSCGLNGAPLKGLGTYPASIACNLTNGKMPHLVNGCTHRDIPAFFHEGDTHYISNIKKNTLIGYKFFAFYGNTALTLRYRGGRGSVEVSTDTGTLGTVTLKAADGWQESEPLYFCLTGRHPLYLRYLGGGKIDLKEFSLHDIRKEGTV